MLRKTAKIVALLLLFVLTWAIRVYHLGVFPRPKIPNAELAAAHAQSEWIDKSRFGMHQLLLHGSAFERGLEAGKATAGLLYRQEKELNDQLEQLVPSALARRAMNLLAIRWFWGIESYFEP